MKTVTEIDEIKRLKAENKLLKQQLADEVIDHKIDEVTLRIACRNLGTAPDELKKKRTAWDHAHDGIRNEALRVRRCPSK